MTKEELEKQTMEWKNNYIIKLENDLKYRNCVDCSNHGSNIKLVKAKKIIENFLNANTNDDMLNAQRMAEQFINGSKTNNIKLAKSFIESLNCKCGEIYEEGNTSWFSVDFLRGLILKIEFNEDNKDECFFVSELYDHGFLGTYTFNNLKNLILALSKSEV